MTISKEFHVTPSCKPIESWRASKLAHLQINGSQSRIQWLKSYHIIVSIANALFAHVTQCVERGPKASRCHFRLWQSVARQCQHQQPAAILSQWNCGLHKVYIRACQGQRTGPYHQSRYGGCVGALRRTQPSFKQVILRLVYVNWLQHLLLVQPKKKLKQCN